MNSTYIVEGMTCQHCATSVSEEISEIGGVTDVRVDLGTGEVIVVSDQEVERSSVSDAVSEAGYSLSS